MAHTIFHIEDEPQSVQDAVYALITRAADAGIQLTPLDFTVDGGAPQLDGMDAGEWIYAVCEMD